MRKYGMLINQYPNAYQQKIIKNIALQTHVQILTFLFLLSFAILCPNFLASFLIFIHRIQHIQVPTSILQSLVCSSIKPIQSILLHYYIINIYLLNSSNMKQVSAKVSVDMSTLLGQGSTGNVYKGVGFEPQPHPIAVKVIPLEQINNEVTSYLLQCELQALRLTAKSPNQSIVKLEQIIICDNHCYIATQLLEGGTLKDLIVDSKKISPQKAIQILQKLLEGYKVLKQNGIIHRDLKPDNILFSSSLSQGSQSIPKIIDFGYCTIERVPKKPKMFYNVGSPRYMSPEAYTSNKYSEKSDIWALGIIFYEMLTGTNFDKGKDILQTFKLIKDKGIPIPSSLNLKCRKILQIMLMLDPNRRATCEDVLKQINQNSSQKIEHASSSQNKTPLIINNQMPQSPQKWNIKELRNTIVNQKALLSPNNLSRSPNPRASWLNQNGMRDSGFLTRSVGFTVSPMARDTRMSVFNSNQQQLLRIQRARMLNRSLNDEIKEGPLTDRNQNDNQQFRNMQGEPLNQGAIEEGSGNKIRILVQNSNNRTLNQSTSEQNLHRLDVNKNMVSRSGRQNLVESGNKFVSNQELQSSERKNSFPFKINEYFRTQRKMTTPSNNQLKNFPIPNLEIRSQNQQRVNFFHQNQPHHTLQQQQQNMHAHPNNQHHVQQIPIQLQHQIVQPMQPQVQVQHQHQQMQPIQIHQIHQVQPQSHQVQQVQQGHQVQQVQQGHQIQQVPIQSQHYQQIPMHLGQVQGGKRSVVQPVGQGMGIKYVQRKVQEKVLNRNVGMLPMQIMRQGAIRNQIYFLHPEMQVRI